MTEPKILRDIHVALESNIPLKAKADWTNDDWYTKRIYDAFKEVLEEFLPEE